MTGQPLALVFSQTPGGHIDAAALLRNAKRFFNLEMEVMRAQPSGDRCSRLELRIDGDQDFLVENREKQGEDLERANLAEQRGKAAGMAGLAARCQHVWELRGLAADGEAANARASLMLQALLASVALGPVLPPDTSTLYGVRGARERADELRR